MKVIYFFILVLPVLFSPKEVYSQVEWELKKEADGIKVYTRLKEGSNIKEFKAMATLPISASQIFAVLKDVEKYPDWIDDVENARTISNSENAMSFYYQLDLPWPVKNRDMALDMNIANTADSIILKLNNNNNIVPENDDFVRMHNVVGQWSLYPISANSTRVIHQFLADPEGSIPAWVVNTFIVDGPYKSMKNLGSYAKTYRSKE